jgi:hypothetical protein
MGRFEIALGKLPPPPPDPSSYSIGINIGDVRESSEVLVGHLVGYIFVVDHTETLTMSTQELNSYVHKPIIDFSGYSKSLQARLDGRTGNDLYNFILLALKSQNIPYDRMTMFRGPWRTLLYEKCNRLNIRFSDSSYSQASSKFQHSFELALSITLSMIPDAYTVPDVDKLEHWQAGYDPF